MIEIIKTTFQIRRGYEIDWERNNPILAEGEPGFCIDKPGIKIGDGIHYWKDLEYIGGERPESTAKNEIFVANTMQDFPEVGDESLIYRASKEQKLYQWNQEKLRYESLIPSEIEIYQTDSYEALPQENVVSGSIGIVSEIISKTKQSYTAYIYNKNRWEAMDGNVNAKNVIFSNDFIAAGSYTSVGNIVKTGATGTIPAAGKSVEELFQSIFTKELNPTITSPEALIKNFPSGTYEVGTQINPTFKIELNPGKYSYGPDTGITILEWEVVDSNSERFEGEGEPISNSFPIFLVEDNTNYSIGTKVAHSSGTIPVTNLNNPYEEGRISQGIVEKSSSKIKGYRNSFYGTISNNNIDLNYDLFKNLTKTGKALKKGEGFTITLPVGAKYVIFAYPSSLGEVSSVKDVNGLNAEIASAFNKEVCKIGGVNNYNPIDYNVYVLPFANPNDKANSFKVVI